MAVSLLRSDEIKLIRDYGLSLGQIKWRRGKQEQLRDRFLEQYPEDDVNCFLASSRLRFDVTALQKLAALTASLTPERIPALPGKGDSLAVAPAILLVWRRPQKGLSYVIGADVAEGLEGGDASAACVLERKTAEQVAELHGWIVSWRAIMTHSGG